LIVHWITVIKDGVYRSLAGERVSSGGILKDILRSVVIKRILLLRIVVEHRCRIVGGKIGSLGTIKVGALVHRVLIVIVVRI